MNKDFLQWQPHPWHGLEVGPEPPSLLTVFVEITSFDHIKYEVDKFSGFLRIDRPQYSSSRPPTVYGFVPKTFCGERVGKLMTGAKYGDEDPLDICVVSSHPIANAQILLTARVVGGIPLLDDDCADDKIIAVLEGDATFGDVKDISELPERLVEQLMHYFTYYKSTVRAKSNVDVRAPYGVERALAVVEAAIADYVDSFVRG